MAIDYDKVFYTSLIPAFMNVQSGTFAVSVSGSLTPGQRLQFNGGDNTELSNGSIKTYIMQNPVPVDAFTDYTTATRLPVPPTGQGFSGFPAINVICSVGGNPSVTSITAHVAIVIGSGGISAVITINNPYSGNMTLTNTTFTFYYNVFAPTFYTA